MEDINFDYDTYTKGFNLGWEVYEKDPELYEILLKSIKDPAALVLGIRDALKQHEQMLKEVEKSKTVKKDKDKGLDMEM